MLLLMLLLYWTLMPPLLVSKAVCGRPMPQVHGCCSTS